MPASAPPLDALAALCKASSDPLRLQILRVLRHDSFGVSELCQIFGIRQPALSHHLKVLAGAQLLARRREGNSIFYRRNGSGGASELKGLQDQLFQAVDAIELAAPVQGALAQLYRHREQNSRHFFRDNASKFHAQQDLIASYSQYADTVAQALHEAPLTKHGLALEVGPGDGSFLARLSPLFERVVALDNAPEMLDQARQFVAQNALPNVDFILGDTTSEALAPIQADCIVINMVLHHTPSPAEIFRDVSRYLAPGGVLLVTDLCRHDQAWARENCGDLWLGFEPADLTNWAADSGLNDLASSYLAQRNGFQIQVRLFGGPKHQGQ